MQIRPHIQKIKVDRTAEGKFYLVLSPTVKGLKLLHFTLCAFSMVL